MDACAIPGCKRKYFARGWCNTHYARWYRTGDVTKGRSNLHGRTGSPEYRSWASMINRCTNATCKGFKYYGGRGIAVCDRWRTSFIDFLADMGERPAARMSLDRIDVNGNYEPSNCRWATPLQQSRNARSNRLTPDLVREIRRRLRRGERQKDIAAALDVPYPTLKQCAQGRTWKEIR